MHSIGALRASDGILRFGNLLCGTSGRDDGFAIMSVGSHAWRGEMNWWSQCADRMEEARRARHASLARSAAASTALVWFCSPLRLSTPLRALRLHGKVSARGMNAVEMEEGRVTGYWRAAGDGAPQWPPGLVPSLIGLTPWHGGELLACLITIREFVESGISIDDRIALLSSETRAPNWPGLRKHPALAVPKMVELFFPSFLRGVPGMPANAIRAMTMLGLDTPAKILAQDPAALLGLKGVGSATLDTLTNACGCAGAFQHCSRTDAVAR